MNRWTKYVLMIGLVIILLLITRDILAPFVLAIATAYIISPVADRMQRISRLPRVAVIALFYLIFIGMLTLSIALVEPEFAQQTTGQNGLFKSGVSVTDSVLDRASKNAQIVDLLRRVGVDIVPYDNPLYLQKRALVARRLQLEIDRATQPGQVREVAQTTFGVLVNIVIWFFATFYLLLNGRRSMEYLYRFVPDDRIGQARLIAGRIHVVLGRYLRGQLYLILIMSILSYIALRIFAVPYALPIAIGSGILEIIPFVGPIIAGTLASLVALSTHGVGTMVGVIIAYFVLREFEDQIIIPQVIGRVVHLDPVVTIFAVLAGQKIAGIIGVLMAVPLAAVLRVLIDELFPPKMPGDEPSALTEVVVADTGLPNDPIATSPRGLLRLRSRSLPTSGTTANDEEGG
ncbi:MAG: AI-2E family transporter, partial [Chloroflexota bacterium]|nr:AI-2E family transporter [Chloroflexota bacterium]